VQVIYNRLYKKESIADKGTLMQLKVILNRQLPSKVKDDPSSVERFFDVVLDSHIVAAALVFFRNG
jgi:hypothetical protein